MSTHPGKNIPILMYHSISEQASKRFKSFAVSPVLFDEQMACLRRLQYTPLTVTQLIRARSQGEAALPEKPVVLTFDDGFADFFTNAFPLLQKYNFVATLYVTTSFVNRTSLWLRREAEMNRLMVTWDQLREMSDYGIECGAHTHSHPQLDTLPCALAEDEIVRCKQILERHLDHEVLSFAYPFGYQTAQTRQLVQKAGYTSACAVKHAMCSTYSDPFALERFKIDADSHNDVFEALLTDQKLSPIMAIHTLYLHARTPLWQCVRRSSISLKRFFDKEGRL